MKAKYSIIITLVLLCAQEVKADANNPTEGFSDVDGTTITIQGIADMNKLAEYVNSNSDTHYEGYTFLLAKDLDYTTATYKPIGSSSGGNMNYFAGTFNGQGKTIRGITIDETSGRQALFNVIKGGKVENLTLANSSFSSVDGVCAGIVALLSNGGTVKNCHVTSTVTVGPGSTSNGGVVGICESGTMEACTSMATVKSNSNSSYSVGGIVGKCGVSNPSGNNEYTTNVKNCFYCGNAYSIDPESNAGYRGAIVGYLDNRSNRSTVNLLNNFYTTTQSGICAVGEKPSNSSQLPTMTNYDEIDGDNDGVTDCGAVRVRSVTAAADITDMGTVVETYSCDGLTPCLTTYTYGVKYGDIYYSHVLTLDNATDNTSLLNDCNGHTYNVKLRGRRLYKDGAWNTLCLPFDLDIANTILSSTNGCMIKEMDVTRLYSVKDKNDFTYKTGCEGGSLYLFFKRVYNVEAGKPYLVKWEPAENYNPNDVAYGYFEPIFKNVKINKVLTPTTSEDGTVTFTGIYTTFACDVEDRSMLFLGAYNTLYYPNGAGDVTINASCAYLQLNGVQMAEETSGGSDEEFVPEGGGDARSFVINIENRQGDIEAIQLPEASGTFRFSPLDSEAWFTLDGRRISNPLNMRKGLYIHNGRKINIVQ